MKHINSRTWLKIIQIKASFKEKPAKIRYACKNTTVVATQVRTIHRCFFTCSWLMLAKLLVDCHFEFEFEIAEEMLWKEAQHNMLQKEGIELN